MMRGPSNWIDRTQLLKIYVFPSSGAQPAHFGDLLFFFGGKMVPKRATFLSYGNDEACAEIRKFIEDGGVLLKIRDLEKDPLSVDELHALIGYIDISHFLNKMSESYARHNLDKELPPRNELFQLMSEDYTLIRQPIVQSTRLVTVGCDKAKIALMLQLNLNGTKEEDPGLRNGNRRPQGRSHSQSVAARR